MICYLGCPFDYSGYGEANRHFIAALNAAGVDLRVQAVSYVHDTADYGDIGQLCRELCKKQGDYKIKILHVTPDQYYRYAEKGKYNIGHLFWETDKLPQEFAKACNIMQEIWTGSETNAEAIKRSGVTVPVFIAPQPIETNVQRQKPYILFNVPDGTFVFYSIFEWTERKNPKALLRAYFEEFSKNDAVALVIKTYVDNFSFQKQREVTAEIHKLRAQYGKNGAKLLAYKQLMDRAQVRRLHSTGDCYVTTHRGEGWGIPIVEAMTHGNPVITTGYNGVHDYLTNDVATLLPFKMIGVDNNRNRHWYTPDQRWADVDIETLKREMRVSYNEKMASKAKGERGKKFVDENFNFLTVGNMLKQRLEVIERKLPI